jgi:hypothetical protein
LQLLQREGVSAEARATIQYWQGRYSATDQQQSE